MQKDIDILSIDRGIVTAPAGCGKTHLIAEALKRNKSEKPILVLTHTNAGVAALRARLEKLGVERSSFQIMTIDGWAIRLVSNFPKRSKIKSSALIMDNPGSDYPDIRKAAAQIIKGQHLEDILRASYERVFVDEYQDCSTLQHDIVVGIADQMKLCAFGDPLQAIFGFGSDGLPSWNKKVCVDLPLAGELSNPWRWINSGEKELGEWLLQARKDLILKNAINLQKVPGAVSWIELNGDAAGDYKKQLTACGYTAKDKEDSVLIIGDSRNIASRSKLASSIPGAILVEPVELKALVEFAKEFNLDDTSCVEQIINFAQSMMNDVGAANLLARLASLSSGKAKNPPNRVEKIAIAFANQPSYDLASDLLVAISNDHGVRAYRPGLLRATLRSLQLCSSNKDFSFYEAAVQVREQNRFEGRLLAKRAVGSTLLVKGLESEIAVVLNADELDSRNLYVAITRGSKKLFVCSQSSSLNPSA